MSAAPALDDLSQRSVFIRGRPLCVLSPPAAAPHPRSARRRHDDDGRWQCDMCPRRNAQAEPRCAHCEFPRRVDVLAAPKRDVALC